ncbi:RNA guanine-N7 methyltransferase activating subunit-like [Aquarana catesbeiana]|uniref:RNA guanine-N7 methyltransferase activating subunit-like n=1 Tax=Aquarana catesbeiana TaxID=8400 RepID=UPI003CCA5999
MNSGDVIVAPPIKELELADPEGRPGEDESPVSGDSVPLEGFLLKMTDTIDIKKMYEDMFADRFTERDEEYQEYVKKSDSEPPIVEDWWGGNQRNQDRYRDNRRHRSWDNRRDSYNSYNQHHGGRGWVNSPHQYRQEHNHYRQERRHGYNSGSQRYQPYR